MQLLVTSPIFKGLIIMLGLYRRVNNGHFKIRYVDLIW